MQSIYLKSIEPGREWKVVPVTTRMRMPMWNEAKSNTEKTYEIAIYSLSQIM
jgi:hypothetical protein